MDIKANALFNELQSMALEAQMAGKEPSQLSINPSSQNFGDLLSGAIDQVNAMQAEAKEKTTRFEMGDNSVTLADVMIAKEKASIGFEATLQVRNKVMEAYKSIMNMPV